LIADLEQKINEILPQTQCQRCGFVGCAPYAKAIAQGEAPINQCPPGGATVIEQLAKLLNVAQLELDPSRGSSSPRKVALIVEQHCIGCTKCLPACPVDAIVGGPKRLHTVNQNTCTGCELCLPVCPVSDCIVLTSPPLGQEGWSPEQREQARIDYQKASDRRANSTTHLKAEPKTMQPNLPNNQHSLDPDQQNAAQLALALALQLAASTHPTPKN
jgi:Na+-translocating ferredoxin:NAD+ oxidoreductase subunit B